MGSGVSRTLPGEYTNMSPEEQEELNKKFATMLADGKSEDEAIEALRATTATTTTATTALESNASNSSIQTIKLTSLLTACEAAITNGKTPLVIDNSDDNKVDTFFSYQSATILDGKKMGLDKSMRKVPVHDIMDETRKKIVFAIKQGQPLIIALTKSVTDFATTFTDEACKDLDFKDGTQAFIPSLLLEKAGKGILQQEYLERLFRTEDRSDTAGLAISKNPDGFHVIITSQFSIEDFEEYLFGNEWGLPKPKDMYQFIAIEQEKQE